MKVKEFHGMRSVRLLVVAVLAVAVLAVPAVVLADGRVALVVGNSTYAHIGRLPNPDNDARDLSVSLRRLGFEVTTEFNVDRVELTEALRAFTRRSAGADVSLVFYAGTASRWTASTTWYRSDARLERDIDVRFERVTVDDLLVSTSGASLRLVILDACRNNPLALSMQRTAATRTVSGGSFADRNEDLLGRRDAGGGGPVGPPCGRTGQRPRPWPAFNLGFMYLAGHAVSQNDAEAVYWFSPVGRPRPPQRSGQPRLDVRERSGRASYSIRHGGVPSCPNLKFYGTVVSDRFIERGGGGGRRPWFRFGAGNGHHHCRRW